MKNSIEKVVNNILSVGKISLNTVIVNGDKNPSNSLRRDSLYYRSYNSEKYSNASTLDQLDINCKKYLVISYKSYDKDEEGEGTFTNKEVWINEMNIQTFKDYIEDAYAQISENVNKIYKKGKITPDYEDFMIVTGYEEDGSGYGNVDGDKHTLFIYPVVCVTTDGNKTYNGVAFGFQENETGEQFGQEMSLNTLFNIVNIMQNYDLITDSRLTLIAGLLTQIRDSSEVGTESASTGYSRPKSGMKARPIKKPIQRRQTLTEAVESGSLESDFADEEDPEFPTEVKKENKVKKTVKTSKTKSATKKASAKETNKISMTDILAEADNIEDLNLDDEGEEY